MPHGVECPAPERLYAAFSASMGDAIRKHMMKNHTNSPRGRKMSSVEIAAQILQHDPGASVEMVASFLSQWGILLDDQPGNPCSAGEKQSQHQVGD
jgi:hypothetical protein